MNKPVRILFVTLAVLMVLFVAAAIGGYLWVNKYLAGDAFRQQVSHTVSDALHVDGTFDKLRWSGFSIYTENFNAQGVADSAVDRLAVQQIRAGVNLGQLFHGVVQLDSIEIGHLLITLKEAAPAVPAVPAAVPPSPVPAPPSDGSGSGDKFRIEDVKVGTLEITWPAVLAGGGSASGIAFDMKNTGGGWAIEGAGGTLAFAKFPSQKIQSFTLRLRPGRLYITRADAQNPDGGTIRASGELGIAEKVDLDLQFDVAQIPVKPLLPDDWRARVTGAATSHFHLTRAGDPGAPWHVDGKVRIDDGVLEGLPALDQIATFTGTKEYRSLKFQDAGTDFVLTPERMDFTNIGIESQGFVRIEGRVSETLADQGLDGLIQLGVPAARLAVIPGAQSQVFTETRGSYVWTPVKIGGTVANPTEDLTVRLMTAAAGAVQEKVKQGVESAVDLFNKLLH